MMLHSKFLTNTTKWVLSIVSKSLTFNASYKKGKIFTPLWPLPDRCVPPTYDQVYLLLTSFHSTGGSKSDGFIRAALLESNQSADSSHY